MEYKRPVFHQLMQRFSERNTLIQVISGPRQIGKTTLVKQLFQEPNWLGIYAIADGIQNNSQWIETQFRLAQLSAKTQSKPVILALDEIQKIPQWSEVIKRLYDEQQFNSSERIQLILLGSSNWLMQKGLSESLAGRFEQWNLNHWTFKELNLAFSISPEEYVYFGAYPGAMMMRNNENRWKSYIRQSLMETAISKDVLLMHRIEKPALLRKLFELGTLYSGQILSYTKIMGQLQEAKNTTTLAYYLTLLQEAGMLTGLMKFAMDQARKRSSSPKWQTLNNALYSSIQEHTFDEIQINPKAWGRYVESAVGAHFWAHRESDLSIYYWNESNAEVDYILQWKGEYIAIEVKTNKEKITGLHNFKKHFKPKKTYQLSETSLDWKEIISIDPRELF